MQLHKLTLLTQNLKTFTKFETLEAKAAVHRPGNQDSLQLSWQGKPEHVPLKQPPLKKQSRISWQLRDTVAGRNQPQIELGFRLRESLLKAFFLTVVMTVTGFVRYSVVADSVEPVAFCVDAVNLNAALYNYMILQDRALIDAIGWSDTSELLGRKPSQVFSEVSDKVRSLIDRMLIKYRTNRIGEDIDAYKQLMNANMCDILAKTLNERGSRYPNCGIAMAGIVNNSFAIFIDKYAQLKDQIMSQWAREPTLESKRAVLYRQETVSYLGYLTINTFGTTDAIYYHFMYPMVSILQGKVVDLQKALKLANVVTGLLGFVCVLAGVALQVAVFRKEYLRFMSILFIVPVGLLVTNAKMKFKLQKSLKDCTSKLNL